MNIRTIFIACLILTTLSVAGIFYYAIEKEKNDPPPTPIRVFTPTQGQTISSPLAITGEARGSWFFEASFPIQLVNADGKVVGTAIAQAQGEWMTNDFVPFRATLEFSSPGSTTGMLILNKDNPSGLPEHDARVSVPIVFEPNLRDVQLFFYDQNKDTDDTGNILCSRQGLAGVDRRIPRTMTPIQDAIRLLLNGGVTADEQQQGITTEFPLEEFELASANLRAGELTLAFDDPLSKTSGGSCRAGMLWMQIEATAKQFPEITSVRFTPETLFQP